VSVRRERPVPQHCGVAGPVPRPGGPLERVTGARWRSSSTRRSSGPRPRRPGCAAGAWRRCSVGWGARRGGHVRRPERGEGTPAPGGGDGPCAGARLRGRALAGSGLPVAIKFQDPAGRGHHPLPVRHRLPARRVASMRSTTTGWTYGTARRGWRARPGRTDAGVQLSRMRACRGWVRSHYSRSSTASGWYGSTCCRAQTKPCSRLM
jgi:hypothetical protein